MSELLATLVPDMISPTFAVVLLFVSFFTSGLTASFGIGGGVIMLAVMAGAMPIATVVPVHGVVQLGSNLGRAVVLRDQIDRTVAIPFVIGSLIGAAAGGSFALALPDAVLRIALAVFIIWTAWATVPMPKRGTKTVIGVVSAIATFLALVMGATGPLVVAMFKAAGLEHLRLVATSAAGMVLQHCLKIVVFGFFGFAFGPWLGLMAAMILTGFLGTLVGSRIMINMNLDTFRLIFRILLTALGLELLRQGVMEMV